MPNLKDKIKDFKKLIKDHPPEIPYPIDDGGKGILLSSNSIGKSARRKSIPELTTLKNPATSAIRTETTAKRPVEKATDDSKFAFFCLQVKIPINKSKSSLYVVGPSLTVGREDCNVCLHHSSISSFHCVLKEENGILFLEDTDSQHGTFVNGIRLKPRRLVILQEGDQVLFGQVEASVIMKNEEDVPWLYLSTRHSPRVPAEAKEIPEPAAQSDNRNNPLIKASGISDDLNKAGVFDEPQKRPVQKLPTKLENSPTGLASAKPPLSQVIPKTEGDLPLEKVENIKKPVGLFLRLMAFSGDCFFTFVLFYNFRFLSFYRQMLKEVVLLWEKTVPGMRTFGPSSFWLKSLMGIWGHADFQSPTFFLAQGCSFLLLFYFLQGMSCLFFGVSFAQACLGLRGGDSFIWNRIGGLIRMVVDFFTWPLFFLNFSCVWGRRTFKEWVTLTSIKFQGLLHGVLFSIFFIPGFLLVSLILPVLLISPDKKVVFQVIGDSSSSAVLKGKKPDSLTLLSPAVNSQHFKFSIDKKLWTQLQEKGSFLLTPNYEIIKRGRFRKIRPFLEIYDPKVKVKGSFRVLKHFPLLTLLQQSKEKNPYFRRGYPHLHDFLENKEKILPLVSSRRKLVQQDIRQLIIDSFSLTSFKSKNIEKFFHFIWEKGPFLHGHLHLQQSLAQEIEGKGRQKMELLTLGNQLFLKGYREREFFFRGQEAHHTIFMPLDTFKGAVYELSWDSSKNVNRADENFTKAFLQKVQWFSDEGQMLSEEVPEKDYKGNLSLLHVLDSFALISLPREKRRLLEEYVYHFYFDLAQKIIKRILKIQEQQGFSLVPNKENKLLLEMEIIQAGLMASMKKFQDVAQIIDEEQSPASHPLPTDIGLPFVRNLQQLQEAMAQKDLKFFEISSY